MNISRKGLVLAAMAVMVNGLVTLVHSSTVEAATITAGSYTHSSGAKSVGYIPSFIGSITGGSSLPVLSFSELQGPGFSYCHVGLSLSSPDFDPGQDWFDTLMTSIHLLTSASASYSYFGGEATWQWFNSSTCGMTGGQNYTLWGI